MVNLTKYLNYCQANLLKVYCTRCYYSGGLEDYVLDQLIKYIVDQRLLISILDTLIALT